VSEDIQTVREVSEDIQKMGCIEDSNTSRGFNQDISEVASAPGAPLGKKERVGFHLRRGEALANFIGERCEALANSKKVKLDPNAVEFIPGRTKSDAESAEKAATKAEDAQKKTDAKEVSDRETDKETAEFESEETVAKEEGDKKPAQKSADEAAAKVGTESAEKAAAVEAQLKKKEKRKADLIVNQDLSGAKLDVHVKRTYAVDLPQVGMKAISQGYEEKPSVPTGTKGYQATDAERKADLVVNKDRSSADEAESAGLYVKDSCAEILPQVAAKDFDVSRKENLSVPIDHRGCQVIIGSK